MKSKLREYLMIAFMVTIGMSCAFFVVSTIETVLASPALYNLMK